MSCCQSVLVGCACRAGEIAPGTRGALRGLVVARAGDRCLQGPRQALRGLAVASAGVQGVFRHPAGL